MTQRFENYAIISKIHENNHVIDFEVKKIIAEDDDLYFTIKDAICNMDTTSKFEDGEMFLSGTIKWDGCSNWNFNDKKVMIHFCGRKDATSIGRLIDHLYQITKECLPKYDIKCAEGD